MSGTKLAIFTIVLDSMPFIGWQFPILNSLSVDWHWVIAEGAAMNTGSTAWCKPQQPRLSRDGTTELLASLRDHPRITVLQRQQWASKDEMCNACLEQFKEPATLVQIDCDEFWTREQLEKLPVVFSNFPYNSAQFFCRYFVGPNIIVTHESDLKNNRWTRAWSFNPGQKFLRHEPPILEGSNPWAQCELTQPMGLVFDHLAYVFQRQVEYKEKFYGYKDAVAHWQRLQRNTKWPVRLKDFMPWGHPNSMADLLHK